MKRLTTGTVRIRNNPYASMQKAAELHLLSRRLII